MCISVYLPRMLYAPIALYLTQPNLLSHQLTVICTTCDERTLISIPGQKECVERKLDSHSDYSAHLRVDVALRLKGHSGGLKP